MDECILDFVIEEDDDNEQVFCSKFSRQKQQWTPHFEEQIDGGVRQFRFDAEIAVDVEYRNAGTGSSVWDASVAVAHACEKNVDQLAWRDMNVLELGAGTGLLSIVLARLGCRVTATDLGGVLPLLQRNVDKCPFAERIQVQCIDWHKPPAHIAAQTFDLIIATDVFVPYDPAALDALAHVISALDCDTVLIGFEERFDVTPFFALIEHAFHAQMIQDENWFHQDFVQPHIKVVRLIRRGSSEKEQV